jgi:ADP-ribose pyrophosphatase YjhB (NUDIX family)
MQHRISAGAIVESGKRILVVRHVRPGKYDFWVAPGGGVQGSEELTTAAEREVREESGLNVKAEELLYIEELIKPGTRHCKFWFRARLLGGELSTAALEAKAEYITEAAWLTQDEIRTKVVFPPVLESTYWEARSRSYTCPVHLGLRHMDFW